MSFASNLTIKGCLDQLDTSAAMKKVPKTALDIALLDATGGLADGGYTIETYKTYVKLLTDAVKTALGMSGSTLSVDDALIKLNTEVGKRAKIATGSYIGTGTVGSGNPNSLTFPFLPKFFWIYGYKTSGGMNMIGPSSNDLCLCNPENLTTSYQMNVGIGKVSNVMGSPCDSYTKISGLTISWFSDGSGATAGTQYNTSGNEYFYVALT
jgi:hypothetical protein